MSEYQCNCGRLFGHPIERIAHAATCPFMTDRPKSHLPRAEGKSDLTDEQGKPDHPSKPPREWWIKIPSSGEYRFWISDISTAPDCMETEGDFRYAAHVIEKSAYLEVCKERDALVAQLADEWHLACDERDALQSQLHEETEHVHRLDEALMLRLAELEDCQKRIVELETTLKAERWVAQDSKLRTYDGLAEKADKYDEAVIRIAELEAKLAAEHNDATQNLIAWGDERITLSEANTRIAELEAKVDALEAASAKQVDTEVELFDCMAAQHKALDRALAAETKLKLVLPCFCKQIK